MERRGSNHKSQITSRQWLDYPQFLSDFAETIQGELEIFPAVGGRDNGPDAGFPPWHGRKPDSLDCLRERADLDVHAAMQIEVVDGAAAVAPEHAARMRIVDHHDAAELVGQVAQRRERAEIAVHAEDAVGDQQLPRLARKLLE